MKHYIDQFMWGFQPHFRHALESAAQLSFQEIGLAVNPKALLIGFALPTSSRHAICVEPESSVFKQEDFSRVLEDAQTRFEVDDERNMRVTGVGQQEIFESQSLDKNRREVIEAALLASSREDDRLYFVGGSIVVEEHRVFPVLSVMKSRWVLVPELPDYDAGRMRISGSLAKEIVWRLLDSASLSLSVGKSPSELVPMGRDRVRGLVDYAASNFVDGIPTRMGGIPADLFERLNVIAATPYEGRAAAGRIRFSARDSPNDLLLHFRTSTRLSNGRQARKILEMSGGERAVVSDGEVILGLSDRAVRDDHFEVAFSGRAGWTLTFGETEMLRVEQGRPTLPRPRLDKALLSDSFERLFGDVLEHDVEAVWELLEVAMTQEHGTMLVVHARAELEAERLGGQAVPVLPSRLSAESLYAASKIDGAILVAPDAVCHAVGVILDGLSGSSGDRSRGARYNSAARYVEGHQAECLILVVSEDGSAEIVPTPRRRVDRGFIVRIVADLVDAANLEDQDEIDLERFNSLRDRVYAHAFYLSQQQCDEIYRVEDEISQWRLSKNALSLIPTKLKPNLGMDDSYFF